MNRYRVLETGVDAVDMDGAVRTIESWIAGGQRRYVCVANVHAVMEAHRDVRLREVYEGAGLTVADGMPLVWVGKLLGRPVARVYGPDLMLRLCESAARHGWSCFLLGGVAGVPERLTAALLSKFPALRVAGAASPPFRDPTPQEEAEQVESLNASGADIVWVGLGCPKQERWMARNRDRLQAAVLIGVGAAFDFHSGRVRQAPPWMRRSGLEWLFRLLQEPRRLWYRYLVHNASFLTHVTLQLLRVRRYQAGAADRAHAAAGEDGRSHPPGGTGG